MSMLRQDRTGGGWVIIAPERGNRAKGHGDRSGLVATPERPPRSFDPACPFCPGNEDQLAAILEEIPSKAEPGWRLRVVPNKFPALQPRQPAHAQTHTHDHRTAAGYGFHEVIIESPFHDAKLSALPISTLHDIVTLYQSRYRTLSTKPKIQSVILFRNFGRGAGASIRHPHAQLLALGAVPPRLNAISEWARSQFDQHPGCVMCAELAFERTEKTRLVETNAWFDAFVPFAATSPFELWLVPNRHQASFADMDNDETTGLAEILSRGLRRLFAVLGPVDYNFVVESWHGQAIGAPYHHWRLRIVPDLVTPGGFELGSGLAINPSLPEADAEALRTARLDD